MGCINKGFSLLLVVILAVSSLMMVESAFAQSIPKPSVPEFTVKVIDRSYDEPISYYTDPYTGKTKTYQGYHVENKTIEIKIKNQQFNNYDSASGKTLSLYYNISAKGHFGDDWMYYPKNNQAYSASGSPYTTLTFLTRGSSNGGDLIPAPWGGDIDVQVQALIGYYYTEFVPDKFFGSYVTKFVGQKSEWSNIQTITIPTSSVSNSTPNPTSSTNPTTAPTSTPTTTNLTGNPISVPLNTLIVVIAIFLAIIVVLSLLLFRKHQKNPPK